MSLLPVGLVAGNAGHVAWHNALHKRANVQPNFVENFGAVGNGVADDAGAINAAADATAAAGGGPVLLSPGRAYLINSEVGFEPDGDVAVDLVGPGMWNTVIKLGTSGAKVRFSTGGSTVAGQRGSRTGGFMIDGQNIATTGLFLGLSDDRTFSDIWIRNCTGTGLAIELLQNSLFNKIVVNNCGAGISFDYGAAANVFVSPEVFDCGTGIKSLGSSGSFSRCNIFYGGLVEHFGTGGAPVLAALVDLLNTDSFTFDGMQMSCPALGVTATPLVKIRGGVNTHISRCILQGGGTEGVGIDAISGGLTAAILTRSSFVNMDCAWKLGDSTSLELIGDNPTVSVAQRFRNQPGGVNAEQNLVRSVSHHPMYIDGVAAGAPILRAGVAGDAAAPRLEIAADGTMILGSGSGAGDVTWKRRAAGIMSSDQKITAVGGFGSGNMIAVPGGTPGTVYFKQPWMNADGEVAGYIVVYSDVTP